MHAQTASAIHRLDLVLSGGFFAGIAPGMAHQWGSVVRDKMRLAA
jgi:hypothetical protein